MPQKKQSLKDIRTSLLARGLSLAKASIRAGSLSTKRWLGPDGVPQPGWLNRMEFLIQELGQLKGTAMKVGQTLSMYGEHLLPKEVNDLFKQLQQNSPPLDWPGIHRTLLDELGEEKLAELEIEQTPVAAASIGQVHRARIRVSGQVLAIKVQYPGIDQAVESDLKLMKFFLNMSELIPRSPRFDQIFAEIREMFYQELDYTQELAAHKKFCAILRDDPRYLVPEVFERYCSAKVLTTEFVVGVRADSEQAQALPQHRRNKIATSFLSLYLRELLEMHLVQTDPHLGNYMIQIDDDSTVGNDRLVLFDFGAVRSVPASFLQSYALLIEGGVQHSERLVETGGRRLGLLLPEDSLELVRDYVDLCFALIEPFADPQWNSVPPELMGPDGNYDWGASDLSKRVMSKVSRIATSYRLRIPPRELVFLDRKLGGVFIFLSVLKCKFRGRELLLEAMQRYHAAHRS